MDNLRKFLCKHYGLPEVYLFSFVTEQPSSLRDESPDLSAMTAWLRDQALDYVSVHADYTRFFAFRFQPNLVPIFDTLEDNFPNHPPGCWFETATYLDLDLTPAEASTSQFAIAQIDELIGLAQNQSAEYAQSLPGTFVLFSKKSEEQVRMTHEELLLHMERFARSDVSDIHLRPFRPPFIRSAGGSVVDISKPGKPMPEDEILRHVLHMSKGKKANTQIERVMANLTDENDPSDPQFPTRGCNFSADIRDSSGNVIGRFRYNVFLSNTDDPSIRGLSAAIRRIPLTPKTPALLGFPPPAELLVRHIKQGFVRHGLIVIAGPTGTGKSTTLASILHEINLALPLHIMTLEDPVEFRYHDNRARFTQIEVGREVPSFESGLSNLLRQDPDIIVIGEIRDAAVAMLALSAAKTGHLVLATLHSATTAVGALKKMMEFAKENNDIGICCHTIQAVIAQKLIPAKPSATRSDRLLAMEIFSPMADEEFDTLIMTDAKPEEFNAILRDPKRNRLMVQTLEQALDRLVTDKLIHDSDAASQANDPAYYKKLSRERESTSGPNPHLQS